MNRPAKREESTPASATFTATEAQNNFGRVLDEANRKGLVYILKYGKATAVVQSIENFRASGGQPSPSLAELSAEYDAMVERMQRAQAEGAVERFFSMSPEEIGQAAVEAAAEQAVGSAGLRTRRSRPRNGA